MLNDNEDNLKAHLKTLHRSLRRRARSTTNWKCCCASSTATSSTCSSAAPTTPDANTYGLASRTQELTARFAVRHPHLEPALRELGNILASMGSDAALKSMDGQVIEN